MQMDQFRSSKIMVFPSHSEPSIAFPYRVQEQVGIGSMGVVYRATELGLDRTVAIKVLRQSILEDEPLDVQQEIRQRFMQEARAAASLAHPGATTVFRVGEDGGLPFIVMEWLEGRTLDEVLEECSRFSIPEATRLVVSVLETLQAAHRNGVIHRDIKPSNLVLLEDGRLKVTDFGIARLQGRALVKTQSGIVLATPKFAAPEQLRGIDVDGRTDLFATGILLYLLVTGQYPFEGDTFMGLANAILQGEPAPMRSHVPAVPPELDTVVRTALSKDLRDRFASAADMAEALRPFLQPTPLGTGPVPISRGDWTTSTAGPVLQDAPDDLGLALHWLVSQWPARSLDRQPTTSLIDRLLDPSVPSGTFSGAAKVGTTCLFVCDGVLVGAVDTADGRRGDTVVDNLPAVVAPTLYLLPKNYPRRLVSLLSSLLHPPEWLHADLDSSLINLPNLASWMHQDRLNGYLHLQRGEAYGLIFIHHGDEVLSVFSKGWDDVPIDQPWQQWVSQTPVRAGVAAKQVEPLGLWFRHTLADLELIAKPLAEGPDRPDPDVALSTSSRIRQLFQATGRSHPLSTGQLVLQLSPSQPQAEVGHYQQAPSFQFLSWALNELPEFLDERKKMSAWKYLAEWLPLVRSAKLHHRLPRPESRQADDFDLVTFDAAGKVLHVGQHIAEPTVDQFHDFMEHVLLTKTARIKSGDVGGVFLIASKLSDDVLNAYSDRVQRVTGIFGLEDSFTGYAGFVRIGTRRGFHLMLVERKGDKYHPLLPS